MITIEDEDDGLIKGKITGEISKADFLGAAPKIETIFSNSPSKKCLLIDATDFQGWEDFSAFSAHINFAEKNQDHLRKIAILGNKAWEKLLVLFASVLVQPEIRLFPPGHRGDAADWLIEK